MRLTIVVAALVVLMAAPFVMSRCGMCIHTDCGPRAVTVYLTPEADARAARICFDGACETIERVDLGGARSFERPLPDVTAVADADDVELVVTLLDAPGGAALITATDDIDIAVGECECDTVEFTWDGAELDRFN
jgi:hypothetical protein